MSAEQLAAHAAALRETHRLHVVVVHPFVVVGGGRRQDVERYAEDVIERSAHALQRQLFTRHPQSVVEIWGLRSPGSYESWSRRLRGRGPISPYGFYDPCRGLIMVDRSLGDGTLVHEVVHVLLEADFPGAPTWLDEGLASLYEQPRFEGERLVGDVNWRLPGLQRQLHRHADLGLEALLDSSYFDFRGARRGLYYALARYLMHYLQSEGRLGDFYRAVRDGEDATDALEATLDAPLATIEARWRRHVMGLGSSSRFEAPGSRTRPRPRTRPREREREPRPTSDLEHHPQGGAACDHRAVGAVVAHEVGRVVLEGHPFRQEGERGVRVEVKAAG